jgi:hypothetical protein
MESVTLLDTWEGTTREWLKLSGKYSQIIAGFPFPVAM